MGCFAIQVWRKFMETAAGDAMAVSGKGREAARARGFPQTRSHWRFSRAGLWPVLLACVLFWTTADEANAMGKMCLFSAVKGVVLDHGKPVEGATIERSYKWMWNDRTGEDAATTDAQGAFSLPVIWGHSFFGSLMPHEPYVRQTILIRHAGKSYEAWLLNKRGYVENDELNGRPISLVCRLEAEPARHGEVFGICEPQ